MNTIGKRIALLREEMGMTVEQLAEKMHCNEEQIKAWESDESLPHLLQFKPLAEALETTTDYLLGAKERKTSII